MNKKFDVPKKVVIGGTFNILHSGHKALISKAFEIGETTIGLTSDVLARQIKKTEIENFQHRKKELEDFIIAEFSKKPKIVKIEDRFGFALEQDFDYIVVSPETCKTAELINAKRRENNKKPIKIIKIKFVLAEDGKPISATRILNKEIDRQGRRLML